jgi:hypothetical protein
MIVLLNKIWRFAAVFLLFVLFYIKMNYSHYIQLQHSVCMCAVTIHNRRYYRQRTSIYVLLVFPRECVHVLCECPGNHYVIFNHTEYKIARFELMQSLQVDTVNIYRINLWQKSLLTVHCNSSPSRFAIF